MTTDGKGFAKQVTKENLKDFAPLLKKETEKFGDKGDSGCVTPTVVDPELVAAQGQFSGKSIKRAYNHKPPKSKKSKKPTTPTVSKTPAPTAPTVPSATHSVPAATHTTPKKGILLWEKILSDTDAQRVSGSPTHCVKLARANFRHPTTGALIDKLRYFRHEAFVGLGWFFNRRRADEEEAPITFDVTIDRKHKGLYKMTLVHKPSGEAGQGNIPTHLLWDELYPVIIKGNFSNSLLQLYAPAPGTKTPYFLELKTK